MNVPIAEVSRILASRALEVCQYLLPGGSKHGHEYHSSDDFGGNGSSLKVTLEGANAGLWKDWSAESVGGDLISLFQIANRHADRFKACDEARSWAGLPAFDGHRNCAPPTG